MNDAWRELVFPASYRNPAPRERYHLVVIGAGPAGLIVAIAAAGLGASVALVERAAMGGDCLNVGCVPSKTLLAEALRGRNFDAAIARVRSVRTAIAAHDSVARYTAAGVDVFLGAARFADERTVQVGDALLRARRFVIATGARAALPAVPGLAEIEPLTNETVFDLPALPCSLAVLGAGAAGCELAQAFARLGARVTLLEAAARVLPNEEPDAAALVAAALQRDGVELRTGISIVRAERRADAKILHLADGGAVCADEVLIAAGRRRNVEDLNLEAAGIAYDAARGVLVDRRLRTTNRRVYAAGEVCSTLQFTHHADAQARIVLRNALFFGRARADRLVVPWCVYTKPELAHVGATRAALDAQRRPYRALRCDFADLDRGRTDDAGDGFAELLVAADSD
ncbi:MAG: FAD-dependent oxidoreductase, partial [Steroidobacteraceae bacterium]|nr:FAD-dependent oxidoreductase [Steroidobacteraceae bacterium]